MTDYLEEVLEEETEDRENFRSRRAAVRISRSGQSGGTEKERKAERAGEIMAFPTAGTPSDPAESRATDRKKPEPTGNRRAETPAGEDETSVVRERFREKDGAEEESVLIHVPPIRRRAAVLSEEEAGPEKRRGAAGPDRETSGEEAKEEQTEETAGKRNAGTLRDLLTFRTSAALRRAETARRREMGDPVPDEGRAGAYGMFREENAPIPSGSLWEREAEELPPGFDAPEEGSKVTEDLETAERINGYAGTGDGNPGPMAPVRPGWMPAWDKSGREDASPALLLALDRAKRAARTVRNGTGTAVVTLPGEAASGWEPDAEALDRLVRLDARRYDGGFQLF